MSGKIKLNSASGGGSVSIQAPSSESNNRTLTLPSDADGTIVSKDTTNNLANIASINDASIGTKNLVHNGNFVVAQRATSSTVNSTASGYGTVDRFAIYFGGTDEAVTQSQVDVASGTTPYSLGFRKALKLTNGNQTSGVGTNDNIQIQTRLEAQDIANSGWNYTDPNSKITLSFWVKSSIAQNFYGYLRAVNGTSQGYPFETGTLTANTWTKVTKTISGNSNLTFNNDSDAGLRIIIAPFFGTAFTDSGVSLNAWGAYSSSARTPDYTSTWYTTNDATFELTGVQLEVGSTASSFAFESYADTLRKCQRYLYILDLGTDTTVLNFQLHRYNYNTGAPHQYITWPVVMRAAPSMTKDGTSYSGGGYQTNITLGAALATAGVLIGDTATSSGESSFHRPNTSSGSRLRYLFSAEL